MQSYDSHDSQWRSADAWRGHSVCQRIGHILDNESPRGYASSSIAGKALRWTRIRIWVDHRSNNTSHLKTAFGYSATRRTSFRSWFLVCQRVLPPVFPLQHPWPSRHEIDHPTSSSSSSTSPTTTVSSDSETEERENLCGIDSCPVTVSSKHVIRKERRDLLTEPTNNPKPNKNEDHDLQWGDPLISEIPEWLQEFRENLVDDRVPERKDSHATSSREPSLEFTPTRSVDLGQHSVYIRFPKDRNFEIFQRTKITRALCRRRNGASVPRAENFGDLITADHKVFSDSCESRNNHRYPIVVQDLATKWTQSYPRKANTSQETQRSLQKFLKPNRKP